MSDFCDGYVFLKPVCKYQGATVIPDFIRPDQVACVQQQEFAYRGKQITASQLNDIIKHEIDVLQKEMKSLKP